MAPAKFPYINRELSWLEFNGRVLEEAQDLENPLFERIKFLAIVCSNLDEFFMVRVGSLTDQVLVGYNKKDAAGYTPLEQLEKITQRARKMVKELYNTYSRSILPALRREGISFLAPKELQEDQRAFADQYYAQTVFPVLTPMVVDQSRPFPLITNRSLNIALTLKSPDRKKLFATVQVPSVLERYILLPSEKGKREYLLLEDLIKTHIQTLFVGHEILEMACYRLTRNADLDIDEEKAADLLLEIEQSIKKRRWGNVIRLEFEKKTPEKMVQDILKQCESQHGEAYEIKGPLDLTFLMKFYGQEGFEDLKYPERKGAFSPLAREKDFFAALKEKDYLLHHPFQRFDVVVQLLQQAAEDENVLAIKQTLYRVSGKSPMIQALARAAENGKQVTVLVELKARFDEENNILWARRLEEAGCHVIYGLVGLKTHCKLLLIVRREEDGIHRYVHLGTGNYNDVTARLYTDMGLLTSSAAMGADASKVFNMLSGFSQISRLGKLALAPTQLRSTFENLIQREIQNCQEGKEGRIIVKMNSLTDPGMIQLLYKASLAGVKIHLLVRGICCLVPGLPGVSENIEVRSVIGRLLEHSRIFYFYNAGSGEVYLSSADWMQRNLDYRVELLFPVEDPENNKEIQEILEDYLADTERTRIMNSQGTYGRVDRRGKDILDVQEEAFRRAQGIASWKGSSGMEKTGEFFGGENASNGMMESSETQGGEDGMRLLGEGEFQEPKVRNFEIIAFQPRTFEDAKREKSNEK